MTVSPLTPRGRRGLLARWESVRTLLVLEGAPDERARTEAACLGALEAWDLINLRRRHERDRGNGSEAKMLEAALRPLQSVVVGLLRHPGDTETARSVIRAAQRRFEQDAGLGPVQRAAGARVAYEAFSSLDALLTSGMRRAG
ncbi:hypothetical protein SA2016_3261 [Sinomonas atrocyanea]|uniref:Uncharacterized protein n=1 Tax=Sinomonas atrocyanea TaxID=37927 RepID=A0A127A580_9MICC|nr:hypothetical protein [Sinomonas atrocyanea]AMM33924.1 hypothetical protein SA2016_3261 [Sinomonas atrocyanea]GEB63456.1 hypothetical protein SAT01_09040 [Sinomonas atrocyanea]GGG56319.1 hypothetical protein GCM10007172_04150 [Sinomonas atrocyanea]